jgi:hypothetical protein
MPSTKEILEVIYQYRNQLVESLITAEGEERPQIKSVDLIIKKINDLQRKEMEKLKEVTDA